MPDLKQKTLTGLSWSFFEKFASQIVTFIVGIILARLLSPTEFGLLGMLTIFIAFSNIFIHSGFNQALIRKADCTEQDFSTVFYFNLAVSIVSYLILFFSSGLISDFFDQDILNPLVKVVGLTLIINALAIVQNTRLTKRVDFKLLTKISLISSIASGVIGISFALLGFGVWSLVYKLLAQGVFTTGLLWLWNGWYPHEKFSKTSFKELFKFSGNLMLLGLIDTIFKNIYYVIIGKFYPAANLGHYTRALNVKKLPAETIANIIDRVSFPVLASIQDNKRRFSDVFRRLLNTSTLLSCLVMMGLAAIARELTILLMGEQWSLAGDYLRILCFTAIFYPVDKLINSVMKVAGRSDLILKLGIVRKFMAIPVIFVAVFVGIQPMLYGLVIQQFAAFLLMVIVGAKFAGLVPSTIFKDLLPPFIVSLTMFMVLLSFEYLFDLSLGVLLLTRILSGIVLVVGLFEILKNQSYLDLKQEVLIKLNAVLKRK